MDNRIPSTVHINNWVIRQRIPNGDGPFPTLLLLHGWTGDENSMWVFTSRFPKDAVLIAPRAPYTSPLGGFSWQPVHTKVWPAMSDFQPAGEALFEVLNRDHYPQSDLGNLIVMGFSQGAAMAYSMLLNERAKIKALAALSGFMPLDAESFISPDSLRDKPCFIAHGDQDDLVPIERARSAAAILEKAGAQVTLCEDEVGHKLSASCFQGLETFIRRIVDEPAD